MAPTASGSKTQGQRGAQHTISHFFSSSSAAGGTSGKRARSPVDLTLDSDEELQPPAKRVKSKETTTTQTLATQASNRELYMSQYTYGSVDDSAGKTSTPEDAAASSQQAARRKLVRETLKQTMEPNGRDVQARSSSVADDAETTQSDAEDQSDGNSPITSLFKDFESNLSVNKRGSTKGKKGKTIEVGPSGSPYTPLELQVLQLKEENPGTLLMFEVGYKYWCVEQIHWFHCLMASPVFTEKMLGLHLRLLG
jgi:DNA mismatch repair protein MSH3